MDDKDNTSQDLTTESATYENHDAVDQTPTDETSSHDELVTKDEQTSEETAVEPQVDSEEITTAVVAADVVPVPEVIGDTVTQTAPELAPEPTPAVAEEEEEEEVVTAPVVEVAEGDANVIKLTALLGRFKALNTQPGKLPEHFADSAKTALAITKFVIDMPKVPVLDALLAFFVEENQGVCSPVEYMKGSTTLPKFDEQKVGCLYDLFAALASKRAGPVNTSQVTNVLRKPEIVGYYNRKRAGFGKAL